MYKYEFALIINIKPNQTNLWTNKKRKNSYIYLTHIYIYIYIYIYILPYSPTSVGLSSLANEVIVLPLASICKSLRI